MAPSEHAGRVALVTGGGKGIGRACALSLAEAGAHVAINYRGDESAAAQTARDVEAHGVGVLLARADVSDPEAAAGLVELVRAELGPISLLVNNAAFTKMVAPERLTLATWQAQFRTNVEAAFHLTWLAREHMMAVGRGSIVNISSTSAVRPDPTMIAYGASKAALNAFTASAALALAPHGIRINAVAPGFTDTPRVETVDAATRTAMLARVPMGRMATAEEIAAVVAFLMSDAASYVTGQVVTAAGGP